MFTVTATLKLDQSALKAQIDKALGSSITVKRLAYQKAYGIFYAAKRAMLRDFDRHPITQEIMEGPEAGNLSGTLDGYGNLFSFIGFHEGDKPTEKLRNVLEEATSFEQTIYRNGAWYFRISFPSREAIELATQMPWEGGNSWAYEVESYISGLSHYVYKKWASSRSSMGLQLPYEYLEDITFIGQPYITEILASFRERVNRND